MRIVRTLLQRAKHISTCGALVHQGAITIVLQEVAAIEYRQSDGRVEVRARGYIAEYVAVRVTLSMTVGLLEAVLDQETEELPGVERAGDVRSVRIVRPQTDEHA